MARGPSRRDSWRNEFSGRRGSGDGFGVVQELATKTLFIQSKKFYIDVKQNRRGKFVKISEVAQGGQKTRLVMDMVTAKEFHERLTEFCDHYSSLGPAKWDRGRMVSADEGKLKSEAIFREDRRYYMDLKENHRGRFLKVSMTLPSHDRTQIVIPAQGMVDIRDSLTDVLAEHGKEESAGAAEAEKPNVIVCDDKTFSFDVGENRRGTFLRISEVSPNFRTAVTVPVEAWEKFAELVEKAVAGRSDKGKPSTD